MDVKARGYVDACRRQLWHLQTWDKSGDRSTAKRIPFRCRSWRHEGECREWCGACDFVRCSEAIASRKYWSLLTLTFPHRRWNRNRMEVLFRFGYTAWSRLRKRLERECGKINYIQTWEIHKSKYPHCHTVISNENVHRHAEACDLWERVYGNVGEPWKRNWLEPKVEKCGFGTICHLAPVRGGAEMAGYLVKLARELTGAGVKNQIPVNAPRHFRRLRASKGLLPKRHKNEHVTGALVKMPIDELEIDDDGNY